MCIRDRVRTEKTVKTVLMVRMVKMVLTCLLYTSNVSITYHASSSVRVEFIGRVSCLLYTSKDGINGTDGKDGANGADGKDGEDGKDGANGVEMCIRDSIRSFTM